MDDWRDRAACIDSDLDFFAPPPKPGATTPQAGQHRREILYCKAVCRGCPVHDDCLDYALTAGERHGVWGGYDETELAEMHRTRRRGLTSVG